MKLSLIVPMYNEAAIIEHAFAEDLVESGRSADNTSGGAPVAVIGSGPAGLAAAQRLMEYDYRVTVFERNEAAGGLLRYGIPNFKLNKTIIARRIRLMEQAGIEFCYGSSLPISAQGEETWSMKTLYSALERLHPQEGGWDGTPLLLATGTPTPRDLPAPGRELKGIYFALDLLAQQNRVLAGIEVKNEERVTCKGKDVLVIGGGDTGSDCIGTAHRQGCRSVTQIEIMPRPVEGPEDPQNPWPAYPRTLKTTSSHEEGCTRRWNINTLEFLGKDGQLTGVRVQEIDWQPNPKGGRPLMVERGKPEVIKADIVLLAMGFLKPEHPQYPENVFVCGDAVNGPSLVVRAMASGLQAAQRLHDWYSSKIK